MFGKSENNRAKRWFFAGDGRDPMAIFAPALIILLLLGCVALSCSKEVNTSTGARHTMATEPDTSHSITNYVEPTIDEMDGADSHGSETWVRLGIIRMNENEELEYTVEIKLLSWYNSYMAALEFCQTVDEGFEVLQDYEIVPAGMTFEEYQNAMQMHMSNILPRGGGKGDATGAAMQNAVTVDICEGDCCLALGKVEGPFFMGAYPPLFYIWHSNQGGWVKTLCLSEGYCECDGLDKNSGVILGLTGIWKPDLEDFPIFAYISDRFYGGLASYIRVTCVD